MHPAADKIDHPSEVEIRAALDRICGSPTFQSSPRLSAFLRFVVERVLAGDSACIKGYTIAVEALGRGPSFDPQTDPIVRVEAGRLRRALARYDAEEGVDDPVRIELPRGCYIPKFLRRAPSHPPPSGLGKLRALAAMGRAWAGKYAVAGWLLFIVAVVLGVLELLFDLAAPLHRI